LLFDENISMQNDKKPQMRLFDKRNTISVKRIAIPVMMQNS